MPADVWLPLYAADYLADSKVAALTFAQQGHLVRLWCFHWRDGPLPNDIPALCRMLGGAQPADVEACIRDFLNVSEDGKKLFSPRLVAEKAKAEGLHAARIRGARAAHKSKRSKRSEPSTRSAPRSARAGHSAQHPSSTMPSGTPSPSPTPLPASTPNGVEALTTTAAPAAPPPSWPAKIAELFAISIGEFPPGRVGKALTAAVRRHGETAIVQAAAAYIRRAPETEQPQFLTPEGFAKQAAWYVEFTTPIPTPEPSS